MPSIQTPLLHRARKRKDKKVNLISLNLIDALIFTINILSINIAADSPDISYNPNSSQFYTVRRDLYLLPTAAKAVRTEKSKSIVNIDMGFNGGADFGCL